MIVSHYYWSLTYQLFIILYKHGLIESIGKRTKQSKSPCGFASVCSIGKGQIPQSCGCPVAGLTCREDSTMLSQGWATRGWSGCRHRHALRAWAGALLPVGSGGRWQAYQLQQRAADWGGLAHSSHLLHWQRPRTLWPCLRAWEKQF